LEITAPTRIFKEIPNIRTHIRKRVIAKNPNPADPGKRVEKIIRRAASDTSRRGVMLGESDFYHYLVVMQNYFLNEKAVVFFL
jgi:hypothetical protein